MSFDEEKLADNITAFVEQVRHAKPAGVKGNYIKVDGRSRPPCRRASG